MISQTVLKLLVWVNQGKWKSLSRVRLFATPRTIQSMEFSWPGYWSGEPFFSPGIFPTQESNPGLLHGRQLLHQLSDQGSPRILEWVAYPFSSRSSQPRNWTGVFCIAGRFFTNWAIREALLVWVTQGISTIFHILRCGEQALIYPSHTLLDMGYSYPS